MKPIAAGDVLVFDMRKKDGSVRRKTKRTKGTVVGVANAEPHDGVVEGLMGSAESGCFCIANFKVSQ